MNKVEITEDKASDLASAGDIYTDGQLTLLVFRMTDSRLWAVYINTGNIWLPDVMAKMPITDALRTYEYWRVSPGAKVTITVGVQ